jgi:hypothetical protein
LYKPLVSPYVSHAPPIYFCLIWSLEWHLVISTDREGSLYANSSNPVTLSRLSPDIFLSTLFSKALSLYSSLSVRDQDSHPCWTAGK